MNEKDAQVIRYLVIFASVFAGAALAGGGWLVAMARNRTMSVLERQAWFTLGIEGLVLLSYALLVGVLRFPWEPSLGVMGVFGWAGLTGVIGRRERREGKAITDERDMEIDRKATAAGFGAFWGAFVLAIMGVWFRNPHARTVTLNISLFTFSIFFGMMIVLTVKSLVVIYLYRRGIRGEAN